MLELGAMPSENPQSDVWSCVLSVRVGVLTCLYVEALQALACTADQRYALRTALKDGAKGFASGSRFSRCSLVTRH